MTHIIHKPQTCTRLDVWTPRYHDKKDGKAGEWVALLAQYKVSSASPIIIVDFTKAKHLKGQRYAIKRSDVVSYPLDSNGKIPCYAVPMSAFDTWETAAEVRDVALSAFDD
jgi:hypothetical protein